MHTTIILELTCVLDSLDNLDPHNSILLIAHAQWPSYPDYYGFQSLGTSRLICLKPAESIYRQIEGLTGEFQVNSLFPALRDSRLPLDHIPPPFSNPSEKRSEKRIEEKPIPRGNDDHQAQEDTSHTPEEIESLITQILDNFQCRKRRGEDPGIEDCLSQDPDYACPEFERRLREALEIEAEGERMFALLRKTESILFH